MEENGEFGDLFSGLGKALGGAMNGILSGMDPELLKAAAQQNQAQGQNVSFSLRCRKTQ